MKNFANTADIKGSTRWADIQMCRNSEVKTMGKGDYKKNLIRADMAESRPRCAAFPRHEVRKKTVDEKIVEPIRKAARKGR